jgi:spermidine/putrescine transport system permease protein
VEQHVQPHHPELALPRLGLRRRLAPYLLGLPAWAYLGFFFVVPLVAVLAVALETGNPDQGYALTWHWSQLTSTVSLYHTQLLRSFEYGAVSTLIALVVSYPVAYWIAFHGGRHKSSLLLLVLLPFFVSFVIRTLTWEFILSDNGFVLGTLKNWHLMPRGFYVLSTSGAVIAGLTYNALPFMVLPLYVALEQIDRRVVRAAQDLYASHLVSFARVVVPLSAGGIFAGFLLVFVTNVGDYVNAAILGGPGTTMIGNIIQGAYLTNLDYPTASALSAWLLFGLLVAIALYARVFGTRRIQDYA